MSTRKHRSTTCTMSVIHVHIIHMCMHTHVLCVLSSRLADCVLLTSRRCDCARLIHDSIPLGRRLSCFVVAATVYISLFFSSVKKKKKNPSVWSILGSVRGLHLKTIASGNGKTHGKLEKLTKILFFTKLCLSLSLLLCSTFQWNFLVSVHLFTHSSSPPPTFPQLTRRKSRVRKKNKKNRKCSSKNTLCPNNECMPMYVCVYLCVYVSVWVGICVSTLSLMYLCVLALSQSFSLFLPTFSSLNFNLDNKQPRLSETVSNAV